MNQYQLNEVLICITFHDNDTINMLLNIIILPISPNLTDYFDLKRVFKSTNVSAARLSDKECRNKAYLQQSFGKILISISSTWYK